MKQIINFIINITASVLLVAISGIIFLFVAR